MEATPGHHQVQPAQSDEQYSAYPFPAPGDSQDCQNDRRWNQVDQQGANCLPKSIALAKHVKGKQAYKDRKQATQNSGCPKQELLHFSLCADSQTQILICAKRKISPGHPTSGEIDRFTGSLFLPGTSDQTQYPLAYGCTGIDAVWRNNPYL